MNKYSKRFTAVNLYEQGFVHLFLVLVIVLVGLGGLLYYSWQRGLIKTIPILKISPTPSETQSEITNWKTYKSDNVFFKYPGDWILDEKDKRVFAPDNEGFIIWIHDEPEYIDKFKCIDFIESKTLNQLLIQKYIHTTVDNASDECWGAGMGEIVEVFISKISDDKNIYRALYHFPRSEETKADQILDQILSTFKFLGPSDQEELIKAIRVNGSASVIVNLKTNDLTDSKNNDLELAKKEIKKLVDKVLSGLTDKDISNVTRFNYIPAFGAKITESGYIKLNNHELVDHISLDKPVAPQVPLGQ